MTELELIILKELRHKIKWQIGVEDDLPGDEERIA